MDSRETVNEMLVKIFGEILDLEERAIITGDFKNMTVNDMHIVDAVGLGEGKNMSAIAKCLGITVGSLTTSMNGLVKKGYVIRERIESDRRVVNIKLTPKGEKAYERHKDFHTNMTEATMNTFGEEEIKVLVKALNNMSEFFSKCEFK